MGTEKICSNCGNTLRPNSKFCGKCGSRVTKSTTNTKKVESQPAPVVDQAPTVAPTPTITVPPVEQVVPPAAPAVETTSRPVAPAPEPAQQVQPSYRPYTPKLDVADKLLNDVKKKLSKAEADDKVAQAKDLLFNKVFAALEMEITPLLKEAAESGHKEAAAWLGICNVYNSLKYLSITADGEDTIGLTKGNKSKDTDMDEVMKMFSALEEDDDIWGGAFDSTAKKAEDEHKEEKKEKQVKEEKPKAKEKETKEEVLDKDVEETLRALGL